jgi:hypothetical protein
MINALGSEQFFAALFMEMQTRKLYLTSFFFFKHFVVYFVYVLDVMFFELSNVGRGYILLVIRITLLSHSDEFV